MKAVEWLGAIFGLLGATLLALNIDVSGYGFVAFLLSNLFWIAFAIKNKVWGLVAMQLGFITSSVLGVVNWLT